MTLSPSEICQQFIRELWVYGMNGRYNANLLWPTLRELDWRGKDRTAHLEQPELAFVVFSHYNYCKNIEAQCQQLVDAGRKWARLAGVDYVPPDFDEKGIRGIPVVSDAEYEVPATQDYVRTGTSGEDLQYNQERFTRDVLLAANRVEYHAEKLEATFDDSATESVVRRQIRLFLPVVDGSREAIGVVAKECAGHNEYNLRRYLGERFTNAEQAEIRQGYVAQGSFGAGACGANYFCTDPEAVESFRPTFEELNEIRGATHAQHD